MRNGMSSGSGGAGGNGGGSILKKSSGGSIAEKRKLMEMSGSDRFALMVAKKTMEVKARLMENKINQMANATDANGESKLEGKAKKMIEMMFKNEFKKDYAKTEKRIMNAAKEREQKTKEMLRGSNNAQTAAQKTAEYQKQQAATQEFVKNFYNTSGIQKTTDTDKSWW